MRVSHGKFFSKLSFVPCRADHKQVLKEHQESGKNEKKKKKAVVTSNRTMLSIEHVQIFKSKEGNHPSLQRGVLPHMTLG